MFPSTFEDDVCRGCGLHQALVCLFMYREINLTISKEYRGINPFCTDIHQIMFCKESMKNSTSWGFLYKK